MTQPAQPVPPVPTKPAPPDPKQLVADALAAIPELKGREPELQLVFGCLVSNVGGPSFEPIFKVPRKQALAALKITRKVTPDSLKTAIANLRVAATNALDEVTAIFNEETAEPGMPELKALTADDASRRLSFEIAQQEALNTLADTTKKQIADIRLHLGNQATPSSEESKSPKAAATQRLTNAVGGFVGRMFADDKPAPKPAPEAQTSGTEAGGEQSVWLREAVLTPDHETVALLELVHGSFALNPDSIQVWQGLEAAYNLTRENVADLCDEGDKLADKQKALCAQNLTGVNASYREYIRQIQAILYLQEVLKLVHDFFFS